jgi:hypothetical protein
MNKLLNRVKFLLNNELAVFKKEMIHSTAFTKTKEGEAQNNSATIKINPNYVNRNPK